MLGFSVLFILQACIGFPPKVLHKGFAFPSLQAQRFLHQDLLHLLWTNSEPGWAASLTSFKPCLCRERGKRPILTCSGHISLLGGSKAGCQQHFCCQPASELKAQAGQKSCCPSSSGAWATGVGSSSSNGSASRGCSHQCSGDTGCGTACFPGREGKGCPKALSGHESISTSRIMS